MGWAEAHGYKAAQRADRKELFLAGESHVFDLELLMKLRYIVEIVNYQCLQPWVQVVES